MSTTRVLLRVAYYNYSTDLISPGIYELGKRHN